MHWKSQYNRDDFVGRNKYEKKIFLIWNHFKQIEFKNFSNRNKKNWLIPE